MRHAYFTGADEPYKKLQRALKAEIDEDAWASLYSTVSRPFDPPSTGKIAVKVINHYGDEVLKVYEVPSQLSWGVAMHRVTMFAPIGMPGAIWLNMEILEFFDAEGGVGIRPATVKVCRSQGQPVYFLEDP